MPNQAIFVLMLECFTGIEPKAARDKNAFLQMIQHIEIFENSWNTQAISNEQLVGVLPNAHVYIFTDSSMTNDDILDNTILQLIPMHTVSTAQQVFFFIFQ